MRNLSRGSDSACHTEDNQGEGQGKTLEYSRAEHHRSPPGGQFHYAHSPTVSSEWRRFLKSRYSSSANSDWRLVLDAAAQCGGCCPLCAGFVTGADCLSSLKMPAILPKNPFFF